MKRHFALFLLLFISLFFTSCGKADVVKSFTDVKSEIDINRYEQKDVDNIELSTGARITSCYVDKEQICDINTYEIENTDGLTIEEFIEQRAKEDDGCYNFKDYNGTTLGLNTFLGTVDGNTVINKTYSILSNNIFYSKQYVFHTNEVRFGDTNQYLFIPKLLEKVDIGENIDDYGKECVGYYESPIEYLPDIGFYYYSNNQLLDYENVKNNWESCGYDFIDENTFNSYIQDDSITLDELNEIYLKVIGDNVSENVRLISNDTEYVAIQSERNINDVYSTEFYILWLADDGGYYAMYFISSADNWPNFAGPVTKSIYNK